MTKAAILLLLATASSTASCASAPPDPRNPYTADQIARLLRGAVSPERILYDATRECIAFRVAPDVRALFADAGAPSSFADSLQAVCYLPLAGMSGPRDTAARPRGRIVRTRARGALA